MKFEIHYDIGEHHDYLIITGDSIKEIREKSDIELNKRGLNIEKNNVYSIEINA